MSSMQLAKAQVIVVDINLQDLNRANTSGHKAILGTDHSAVEQELKEDFCVITATGVKNVISNNYKYYFLPP